MSSIPRSDLSWVGLDVHKDSIHVGLIRSGSDAVELGGGVSGWSAFWPRTSAS